MCALGLRWVFLPDTIIFKYGRPIYWYFTGTEGEILRKAEDKLNAQQIWTHFTARPPRDCDIFAFYFYTTGKCIETFKLRQGFAPTTESGLPQDFRGLRQTQHDDVITEFLDKQALGIVEIAER
jgi:hypothetical protein